MEKLQIQACVGKRDKRVRIDTQAGEGRPKDGWVEGEKEKGHAERSDLNQ